MTEFLLHWSEFRSENEAYVHTDGEELESKVTFAQLDRKARAVASRLKGMEGQRILLMLPPDRCLEFVYALFGCFYAGAIAVPAFPPRRSRNAQHSCGAKRPGRAGLTSALRPEHRAVEEIRAALRRYCGSSA